ncbi:hypothetical protein FSP39_022986 [Pinctada imbricata]|uniref:FAM234A/B beta-propeller domain-containing protein n=1 Tax=Pinctada imbricata TaxID=66713 RepID=A0AA89C663_PINIB|nr:hypothetical protein FSP39_022986 [Pinctada imbricata]
MLESPIHRNETRVIFSKKRTYKNGFTNTESNGFHSGNNGFKVNNNDDVGDDADSELYSDDDDVFMDGPSINKELASKPLMHPRHRSKVKRRRPNCKCHKTAKPILCFLLLVISLGSLMVAILYVSNQFSLKSKSKGNLTSKHLPIKSSRDDVFIQGCDEISVEDVWTVGLPKLNTESAIRMIDVNKDGVLDIILGFGTGADGYYVPRIVCDIYFNGTYPCFGGVLALDGTTGKEIWRHYSPHELFGINCNADLDNDGVLDCVCGGRAGAFQAISGRHGQLLWSFDKMSIKNEIMNLYTAQIIPDQNGDGMVDVLAIHGGDPLREPGSKERLAGRIIFFSGRTGDVLSWAEVPDHKESYYSLQAKQIYTDAFKGVMTPPVLVDITGDGVEDVVMSMFNSTVMAIDGLDYSTIWRYHTEMSESYNTPAAGFYNGDDIPDFMIKYAHGPGYPVYYYSRTTILDGKTGKPLIVPQIKDTVGAQSSPLTISVEGQANDIFLYWLSDCLGHGGEGGVYQFVNGMLEAYG